MIPILLASASPRRQKLLRQMGIPFSVSPQDVDETFKKLDPKKEAVRIATLKVEACAKMEKDYQANPWILGADTFIVFGKKMIGKPKNKAEAFKMLKDFSGKKHLVITGVALMLPSKEIKQKTCTTEVEFSKMSNKEIEWYLNCAEWQGVAGAYKIQGRAAVFVKSINGSFSNVMGLPIKVFYGMLCANNYHF